MDCWKIKDQNLTVIGGGCGVAVSCALAVAAQAGLHFQTFQSGRQPPANVQRSRLLIPATAACAAFARNATLIVS